MCWRSSSLAGLGWVGGRPPALLGAVAPAMAAATDAGPMIEGRLDSLESRGGCPATACSSRGRLLPTDGPPAEGPGWDAVVTDIGTPWIGGTAITWLWCAFCDICCCF